MKKGEWDVDAPMELCPYCGFNEPTEKCENCGVMYCSKCISEDLHLCPFCDGRDLMKIR